MAHRHFLRMSAMFEPALPARASRPPATGRRLPLYVDRVGRLARSRERAHAEDPWSPSDPGFEASELAWRADVYRRGAWTSPLTPATTPLPDRGTAVRRQPAELERWVRRELIVLLPEIDTSLIRMLVLSLLRTPGSRENALQALQPFLESRTCQFWHELR